MRREHIGTILTFALLLSVASSTEALDIVKDGKPTATIVISGANEYWDNTAAGWLQQFIRESTGANLAIVSEKQSPPGTIISVGHTELARQAKVDIKGLKYDGCKLVVRGKTLFLLGRDTPGIKPKSVGMESGANGTCRAVTKFLEDYLGVRWILPTQEAVKIVKHTNVSLPDNLNIAFNPAFAFASGSMLGYPWPYGIANNYRSSVQILSYGGHSYYSWVPVEKYYDSHPEYFAMKDGKRMKSAHLCTTNPEVRELLKKGLFAEFEKGYDWVELGQTDGYMPCQCPICEALDNYSKLPATLGGDAWLEWMKKNPCERLHLTHKWLIDEARKAYPDKKVMMLAYGPTSVPSNRIKYYGENAVIEVCNNGDPKFVNLWKDKASGICIYVCWFDPTISYNGMEAGFTPAQISERLRALHQNNVQGIYLAGGGYNWGFMGPTYYVLGRMMGDPNLDYNILVKEYCEGLYGNAAVEMESFFNLLFTRMTPPRVADFSGEDMLVLRYPPVFLSRLEGLLNEAEAKADTENAKNFIRMTRDQFNFNKLLCHAVNTYRSYQFNPTPENWRQVKSTVVAFDDFRNKVIWYDYAGFAAKWFPGYDGFCNYLTSDGSEKSFYSAGWLQRRNSLSQKQGIKRNPVGYEIGSFRLPLTLDLNKEPTLGQTLTVSRTTLPPVLDGPEWASAQPQLISLMTPKEDLSPTSVRALYDDKAIYLLFECNEPSIDKIVAKGSARDGAIYDMDCAEAFFDPRRTRRQFYHLIAAPAAEALYDEKVGFKTANDADISWNADCAIAFRINQEKKQWFLQMTIPFSSLETTAPKPGDRWLGNFAREREAGWVSRTGGAQPELFLWSQGSTYGFTDPAAFGEILFEK